MVITFIFIIGYLLNSFVWMSFIFNTEKKIYIIDNYFKIFYNIYSSIFLVP